MLLDLQCLAHGHFRQAGHCLHSHRTSFFLMPPRTLSGPSSIIQQITEIKARRGPPAAPSVSHRVRRGFLSDASNSDVFFLCEASRHRWGRGKTKLHTCVEEKALLSRGGHAHPSLAPGPSVSSKDGSPPRRKKIKKKKKKREHGEAKTARIRGRNKRFAHHRRAAASVSKSFDAMRDATIYGEGCCRIRICNFSSIRPSL